MSSSPHPQAQKYLEVRLKPCRAYPYIEPQGSSLPFTLSRPEDEAEVGATFRSFCRWPGLLSCGWKGLVILWVEGVALWAERRVAVTLRPLSSSFVWFFI